MVVSGKRLDASYPRGLQSQWSWATLAVAILLGGAGSCSPVRWARLLKDFWDVFKVGHQISWHDRGDDMVSIWGVAVCLIPNPLRVPSANGPIISLYIFIYIYKIINILIGKHHFKLR